MLIFPGTQIESFHAILSLEKLFYFEINSFRSSLKCKCISASVDKSTRASRSSSALQRTEYSRIRGTSVLSCTTASGASSNCAYLSRRRLLAGSSSAKSRSAPNRPPGITRPKWTAVPSLRQLRRRPSLHCHYHRQAAARKFGPTTTPIQIPTVNFK